MSDVASTPPVADADELVARNAGMWGPGPVSVVVHATRNASSFELYLDVGLEIGEVMQALLDHVPPGSVLTGAAQRRENLLLTFRGPRASRLD
ncbi:hypothetical protein [Frankia sp. R82]|uniref:hypothetical protein n=1 Tax=Frankia sp. R82 TaxID=2950553 RepID=UPI002044A023|nr:hypothetical protein [Frankia sp. R82]MCM3884121.1 hypothetical protein [Frankia sp. R82]